MHLHLDPVGGVAGDMFAAAILDAWPEFASALADDFRAAGLAEIATLSALAHRDHALTGTRFVVQPGEPATARPHRRYADIRARLDTAPLDAAVRERAQAIFAILAQGEARVHGTTPEAVTFHEVGAWDSVADVVCAAWLIERFPGATWSCAPLPMGSGRVDTAHGELPVPAPVTTLILEGYPLFQDDHPGERVTPTGAAILRHLEPRFSPMRESLPLARTGTGFGTRVFDGMSNILRVLAFETATPAYRSETVLVCEFEIDDQSPEDLALGLERLRDLPDVLDVAQTSVTGKRGRLAGGVRVLARPEAIESVIESCFEETTTLGVRWHMPRRAVLERHAETREVDGVAVRVKHARRPRGARTVKAEIADVAAARGGHAGREQRRRAAEHPGRTPDEDA